MLWLRKVGALAVALGVSCHSPRLGDRGAASGQSLDPDTTGAAVDATTPDAAPTVGATHSSAARLTSDTVAPVVRRVRTPDAPVSVVGSVALCCDEPSGLCYVLTDGAAACESETSQHVDCSPVATRCIDKDLGIYVCAD